MKNQDIGRARQLLRDLQDLDPETPMDDAGALAHMRELLKADDDGVSYAGIEGLSNTQNALLTEYLSHYWRSLK